MKHLLFLSLTLAVLFAGCKNTNEKQPADSDGNTPATEQTVSQPKTNPIDTVAVFNLINEKLKALSDKQLWSKDIFTPEYYEVSQKLSDFSDGDALWCLGSIQEAKSIELTDISEFKMLEPALVQAEALVYCKDFGSGMEGAEYRTICLVLKDNTWLIDDVANSKQDKLQALKDYEELNK